MDVEIQQSLTLRTWRPRPKMLDAREIRPLYAKALGHRGHLNYGAAETLMLYACACDTLQWFVGEKLVKTEPICTDILR